MYEVRTMGDLSSQAWPEIPAGWVPAGTPGLPGMPAPVPGPPSVSRTSSLDGGAVVVAGAGGVVVGALGMWAAFRLLSSKKKGRRR